MVKNLPKWLERTDDEIAAEKQIQEQRRAGHTRAHLTDAERLVSRGALLEETARGNLAAGMDARPQLAEALAMQGRYEEAAQHHPDKEARGRYRRVHEAIERDDEEKCACPDTETKELTITPRYNARTVFSARHGKEVMLITCSKCGHENARPPKSRLLLNQAAMSQNTAAARGGGRSVSDVQLLKKPQ